MPITSRASRSSEAEARPSSLTFPARTASAPGPARSESAPLPRPGRAGACDGPRRSPFEPLPDPWLPPPRAFDPRGSQGLRRSARRRLQSLFGEVLRAAAARSARSRRDLLRRIGALAERHLGGIDVLHTRPFGEPSLLPLRPVLLREHDVDAERRPRRRRPRQQPVARRGGRVLLPALEV